MVDVQTVAEYQAERTFSLKTHALEQKLARADARIAELVEALDTLTLVVGLTAFKHESQRSVLQEAMNKARAALAKAGANE